MEREIGVIEKSSFWKVGLIITSWMAILGFDFLLHAGLFASIYTRSNPALLNAEQAFYRIPIGYSSFFVVVIVIYWLLSRIGINEWKKGVLFGMKIGVLLAVASILGLYSILRVDLDMLIVWQLGYMIEFGIVGGIIGGARSGISLKKLFLGVVTFVVFAVIFTIILQILGFAPPMEAI
jgi:hypothetical protein